MNGLLLKDWISLRAAIVLVVIVFVFCTALFVPWSAVQGSAESDTDVEVPGIHGTDLLCGVYSAGK